MSMNKILLIGNVGSDPEMRYTPNGAAVTSFSLATNRVYTTADGERREETEWFRVSAWGRDAENCNTYVTKGMKVYVEGRLSSRSWTGNDGQARFGMDVSSDRVLFLDRGGDSPGREGSASSYRGGASVSDPAGGGTGGATSGPVDDVGDLPW